jgi:hypothetical protein
MLYLKCTLEVQKVLGLHKESLAEAFPSENPLGNWYVNRVPIGRRKAFIFMSETTLLSFLLFQGKKPITTKFLSQMFLAGLEQLLQMRGFPKDAIDKAFQYYETGLFAKTDNRADLGSLNDLVKIYQCLIESQGGFDYCDLTGIIMKVNETPQRRIGWVNSWDITHSKLCKLT